MLVRVAIAICVVASLVSCRRKTNDAVHADDPRPVTKHAERTKLHRDDPRVAQIAATSLGVCARREDGRVSCWLQYGVDLPSKELSKPRELDVHDVVQLAGGWARFCGLHEDGTVTCWGGDGHVNIDGSLWEAPAKVVGVRDAVEIAAGETHACARIADGSVLCWGTGTDGQLGDGTLGSVARRPPTLVKGLSSPTRRIVAAGRQTCALGEDALVRCWGTDFTSTIAITSLGAPAGVSTAHVVSGLTDVRAIWAHKDFDCARLGDGSIRCWGAIMLGEPLHAAQVSRAPDFFHAFDGAKELALKGWHACRVENDGTLGCLGRNDDGELGDGTQTNSLVPVPVKGLTHVLAAAVTADVSCALTEERKVFCWGGTALSGVGDGTRSQRLEPTPIEL